MKKFVLLALFLLVAGLVWPTTRPHVLSRMGPIPEYVAAGWKKAKIPFLSWVSREEAKHLVSGLKDTAARGHPLPKPAEFHDWSKRRLNADRGGLDPWGNKYVLLAHPDSFVVATAGPDNEMKTKDDIRATAPRR